MVKQVIVMRKDLKMRRGKEIAQGSHASNAILIEVGLFGRTPSNELIEWINTGTTKATVYVNSEEELLELYAKAQETSGLFAHVVTDQGRTEFHGNPTKTCLALGPADVATLDKITGHLPLY